MPQRIRISDPRSGGRWPFCAALVSNRSHPSIVAYSHRRWAFAPAGSNLDQQILASAVLEKLQ